MSAENHRKVLLSALTIPRCGTNVPSASDLTLRSGVVRAKGKEKRRAAKERKVKERAKAKEKERAAAVAKHGGSSDLSLGAGTTVIPMTVECMIICLTDLPTPSAVKHTALTNHFLLMLYILFVIMIMTASLQMHSLLRSVYHLGQFFRGYVSDLVSRFFRVDFADRVRLTLNLM